MAQFPFKAPTETLYLPQEDVREGRWTEALAGGFDYLDVVTDNGRAKENLGQNLVRFCAFVLYTAEVNNGGHGQYLDNCQPSIATLEALKHDIDRFGSPDYAAIFADYLQEIRNLPPGKSHTDGSFTGCDLLKPLDKRYFALWYSDPIERHMVLFLEKQPWVKLAPQKSIAASSQAIRKLRQMKQRVTMPSPAELVRFVENTSRLFGAWRGRS